MASRTKLLTAPVINNAINNQLHPVPSARNPPQGGSLGQTAPQAPRSGAQSLIGRRDRPATCASRERAAERGRMRTQRSIRDRDDLTALRYPAELKPCQSRHIQSRKVRAQRANRVDRPPRRNRAQTLCKPPSPDALAPCAGTQVTSPTRHILSHAVLSRSECRRGLLAQRDCQESFGSCRLRAPMPARIGSETDNLALGTHGRRLAAACPRPTDARMNGRHRPANPPPQPASIGRK